MFMDFNLKRFYATDFEDFEVALYEEFEGKIGEEDMNSETEIYWNYCYTEDFEDIIKQHFLEMI